MHACHGESVRLHCDCVNSPCYLHSAQPQLVVCICHASANTPIVIVNCLRLAHALKCWAQRLQEIVANPLLHRHRRPRHMHCHPHCYCHRRRRPRRHRSIASFITGAPPTRRQTIELGHHLLGTRLMGAKHLCPHCDHIRSCQATLREVIRAQAQTFVCKSDSMKASTCHNKHMTRDGQTCCCHLMSNCCTSPCK